MISKEEIIKGIRRIDDNSLEIDLYSNFIGDIAKLNIFSGDSTSENIVISDHLVNCIQDFVLYDTSELEHIQSEIYREFINTIEATEYAMVPEDLYLKHDHNHIEANREYFGIYNKEQAFKNLNFEYASVVEYSTKRMRRERERYVGFYFEMPWDSEHGLQIELENRKFKQIL